MREPLPKEIARLLIAGLVFAIVANVLIITFEIQWGTPYSAPGNLAAIVICSGAIWLVRARQKGRL